MSSADKTLLLIPPWFLCLSFLLVDSLHKLGPPTLDRGMGVNILACS